MLFARMSAIEYVLPESVLDNEELARDYPEWPVEKIFEKTGIRRRRIAREQECGSDLAFQAAQKLFDSGAVLANEIDFILYCTQSADYFLPTTACLLQDRLGIQTTAGAFDFNLGCSGFVYGLGMAKGLVETGQARCILLVTAETYSKFINKQDRGVRTIFGDAAAAILIRGEPAPKAFIGVPIYGTDGAGYDNLIVPAGGMRIRKADSRGSVKTREAWRSDNDLYMNGPEVFAFTLRRVPPAVEQVLKRDALGVADVDLFVFHQANKFMLEHLSKKCAIPREKFVISMENVGNTVSCSIPIALKTVEEAGGLRRGMRILLAGFGVGYSWAACIAEW